MAVVLAGVLFAIIVTIKEWNQAAPTKKPSAGREQVGAPEINFDQPERAPAANAFSDQPELVPAANAVSNQPDGAQWRRALESDEPIAPDAAGYADGAEQVMGSYSSYPSTGVEPVQPQSCPLVPLRTAPGHRLWTTVRYETRIAIQPMFVTSNDNTRGRFSSR